MAGRWATVIVAVAMLPLSALAAALPPIVESRPIDAQGRSVGGAAPGAVAGSLEERVSRLERQADNPILLEMLGRLEALQQEVQELRGTVEMQAHKLIGVEQRQRDLYLDIDRRMRQLESGGATAQQQRQEQDVMPAQAPGVSPAVAAPSAAAGAAAGTGIGAQDGGDPDAEQLAYQRAFDDLQAGRYEASIAAFRNFLARYPDGQYSANAQYWLGEAMYVTRQFSDAVAEFDKVVQHYPGSGKVPDALLKLGFSHYELQDWNRASEALNRVVTQYPASTARQLAENRLHRMRVEGR